MADGGWIKLYRSVRSNWIWQDGNERYAKWWIDILMMVNHEPRKVLVNGKLITIGVGERLTSIKKLSDEWGASRNTVDKFLALLVEDDMISLKKSKTSGTTIKVRHYADYQAFDAPKSKGSEHQTEQRTEQPPEQGSEHKQEPKEPKELKNSTTTGNLVSLETYQQNFGPISPLIREKITDWVGDFQNIGSTQEQADKILGKGMEIAVTRNKRSFGYVEAILRDWEGKGLNTVEAIDAESAQWAASHSQTSKGRKTPVYQDSSSIDDDDLPF